MSTIYGGHPAICTLPLRQSVRCHAILTVFLRTARARPPRRLCCPIPHNNTPPRHTRGTADDATGTGSVVGTGTGTGTGTTDPARHQRGHTRATLPGDGGEEAKTGTDTRAAHGQVAR